MASDYVSIRITKAGIVKYINYIIEGTHLEWLC